MRLDLGPMRVADVPRLAIREPKAAEALGVDAEFTAQDRRTLHRHRGEFLRWTGTYYASLDNDELRAAVYRFAEPVKGGAK